MAGDGVPKTLRDKLRLTCIRFSSRWAGRLLGKWLAAMALGAGSACATTYVFLCKACIPLACRWAGRLLGTWLAAISLGVGSACAIYSKEREDKVPDQLFSYVELAFGFLRAGRGDC